MIDEALRNLVRQRAGNRCEYCRLPQHAVDGTFHIEHIFAQQHPDDDRPSNLALACDRCNFHKGTNLSSLSETGQIVNLFNPRTDAWSDHFELLDAEIVGLTPAGRATVRLLQMNAKRRVELRSSLIAAAEF